MSEIDRIEAMRAAGTLSDDEADRLIAVLRDLGGVPAATRSAYRAQPSEKALKARMERISGNWLEYSPSHTWPGMAS